MEVHRMEVGGPFWTSCASSWTFVMLMEVGGRVLACMGAGGGFPRIWPWGLRFIGETEGSTSTVSGNVRLPPWR